MSRKNQSIAPSIALGLEHADARHGRRADHATGQPARLRDSRLGLVRDAACADDGHRDEAGRSARISTAASATISTRSSRRAIPAASSTTSTATSTLRNQTRYNQTHRTAVITTVQIPASFVPETQTVTLARQGNERENDDPVEPDEPVDAISSTGRMRHAANAGVEIASEEQFAPTLVGIGTRNPRQHLRSRTRSIPSAGLCADARPGLQPRQDEHGRRLCLRHGRA